MTLGTSLFLIAVGAILKYAVTWTVVGINLHVVGVILIVAGVVGLVISLFFVARGRQFPPPAGY
jgi:hypothetical protein